MTRRLPLPPLMYYPLDHPDRCYVAARILLEDAWREVFGEVHTPKPQETTHGR